MSVARFSWVPNLYNIHFLVENHRSQPDPVNSYRDLPAMLHGSAALDSSPLVSEELRSRRSLENLSKEGVVWGRARSRRRARRSSRRVRRLWKTLFLDLVPFLLDLDTFHGPYYNSFGDGYPSTKEG